MVVPGGRHDVRAMRGPERLLTPVDDGPRETAVRRLVARRAVVGVVAGALLMLVATGALAATGADLGFLGLASSSSDASGAGGAASDGDTPPVTTRAGACLTWTREDAADVVEVDCARPHLFEGVGPVQAPGAPGSPFPDDATWQQFAASSCVPPALTAVGGRLDPVGRYRVGALKPTRTAWEDGDRTVRCGLQAPGRTGALFRSTGLVRDADQAVVFTPGTCLGLVGKEVSDPVDCAVPHAAEVTGTVDLGRSFPAALPSVDDQDAALQPACTDVATAFVGGPQKLTDSRLTVYWTNLAAPSWDAGTRRVSCNLGTLLPDGSGFAPLTGRAATGVVVGGPEAVVPAPRGRPGAPADDPGTTADDAATSAPTAPDANAPVVPGAPTTEPGAADPAVPTSGPVVPTPVPPLTSAPPPN